MMYIRGVALISAVAGLALSFFSGGVALSQAPVSTKGDRELGEHLSSMCTACHQITGRSTGAIPPIVAWPDDQFIAVIQSYKDGDRDNETMRTISHRLSQEDIEALAAYFGSLPRQPDLK